MDLLKTEFTEGDPPTLKVAGELDVSTADQLDLALASALSADPRVVVDMADVTFFDAAGVRVLLHYAASRNGTGPLTIHDASPRVVRILELLGLTDLLSLIAREEGDLHDS